MKRSTPAYSLVFACSFIFLWVVILAAIGSTGQTVQAQGASQQNDLVPRGGQLYDKWFAVLKQEAPQGNMPLWARQNTNTKSGPDTWRCVSCHGWDYQGKDGAYRSGANYTGFPGLMQAANTLSAEQIVAQLKGSNDPAHDFSSYLADTDLSALAQFLKSGLANDNEFIDPVSLEVKSGNLANGKQLYDQRCASCHGADGTTIRFRFEGIDATLGTLAKLDPWRFLHKTRYGTPGTPMPIGYELGWTAQEGRDVLLYAQSLPSGLEAAPEPPSMSGRESTEAAKSSGPARNIIGGLATALGAIVIGVGFALILGGALVGIIFVVVWLIRGRR